MCVCVCVCAHVWKWKTEEYTDPNRETRLVLVLTPVSLADMSASTREEQKTQLGRRKEEEKTYRGLE